MMWGDIKWPKLKDAKGKTIHDIVNAFVECPGCQAHIDDETRQKMALAGRWIATNSAITNRAGFWA